MRIELSLENNFHCILRKLITEFFPENSIRLLYVMEIIFIDDDLFISEQWSVDGRMQYFKYVTKVNVHYA